jgi:hypothetical protein
MAKRDAATKALGGLKSIKLTAAQEFRIQEQRGNYEALMRIREMGGKR